MRTMHRNKLLGCLSVIGISALGIAILAGPSAAGAFNCTSTVHESQVLGIGPGYDSSDLTIGTGTHYLQGTWNENQDYYALDDRTIVTESYYYVGTTLHADITWQNSVFGTASEQEGYFNFFYCS